MWKFKHDQLSISKGFTRRLNVKSSNAANGRRGFNNHEFSFTCPWYGKDHLYEYWRFKLRRFASRRRDFKPFKCSNFGKQISATVG
jgi:hypothetical protein